MKKHKCKYGKVNGKYQYCEICGKAIPVPCNHKWEEKGTYESTKVHPYSFATEAGIVFIKNCIHCGEMKVFKFT